MEGVGIGKCCAENVSRRVLDKASNCVPRPKGPLVRRSHLSACLYSWSGVSSCCIRCVLLLSIVISNCWDSLAMKPPYFSFNACTSDSRVSTAASASFSLRPRSATPTSWRRWRATAAPCSSSSRTWVIRSSERCLVTKIGVLEGREEALALLLLALVERLLVTEGEAKEIRT
jgi:hypothetical protein